jgi:carbon-monoxide dehydrogenase large subunit
MGRFGVGQPMRRVEDQRFLTGQGRYNDDVNLPGQAYGALLRSPLAHAEISSIDTAAAQAAPGVLAVYTAADLSADGIGDIPCLTPMPGKNGSRTIMPPHPVLARERVRHVGDPVAFVVAETAAQARDACELIEVDYAELPVVTELAAAVEPSAPQVWEQAPNNVCLDWEIGDRAATEAAFAKADHVTRLELVNNRVVVAPMEPRGAIGDYDGSADQLTLYTGTQGGMRMRPQLADKIFKVPGERVRIVTPDVGGSFGMKIFLYGEQVMVLYAARKLGRPVKWSGDRSECFLSDSQGRDQIVTAELALDKEGRILGLRSSGLANMGAYLSNFAPLIPTGASGRMFSGLYAIPAVHMEVKCVFTNSVPVDAYRGAGRPEAAYIVERLVDAAAREIGLTPDEMRRRNFIQPAALPYTTATGVTYDSGDFLRLMEEAMAAAGWRERDARKADARRRGKLHGIGLASYVEACSAVGEEDARIRMDEDGGATVWVGTQTNGQGHATAYIQLLNDRLGLEPEMIRIRQGDTGEWAKGGGTGGSRSLLMGGLAIHGAADLVLERARKIAGHLLEAAEADIEFADGDFTIVGTDRRIALGEVAKRAAAGDGLPQDLAGAIDEEAHQGTPSTTFPNGCHVCELEIDEATGRVAILRYVVVDDFGRLVNPLLVKGQIYGGIAQGVGQALLEETVYDPDSGQLVTGSFMDYCMPRADDLPDIEIRLIEDYPCRTNAMGVKGAGEAGAIGAPPAVMNALIDALAPLGVRHIDMPATPHRIWRAIQAARSETQR